MLIFFDTLILRARLHVPHVPQADATMAATVSWKPRASSGWLMVAVRNPLLDLSWKEKQNLLDCERKPLNRIRFVRSFFCSFSRMQQHVCPKLARSRDGAVSRSLAFFGIPSSETTVSATQS